MTGPVSRADRLARAADPGHVSPAVAAGPVNAAGSLPVGSPGKVGVLDLDYRVADDGRTVLADRYQKSPLQVMRPLYVDPGLPHVPVTYLMSTGGGVVGGDRLDIDVRLADRSHAVITTQAATRIHRMDAGYATQNVTLTLGAGAVCEWVPDPLIPYAGSRFQQSLRATVPEDAVLMVSDVLTAGRVARGERWAVDALVSRVELARPDGTPVVVDATRIAGGSGGFDDDLVTGGSDAIGTLFVLAPGPATDLADSMRAGVDPSAGVCGVSTLPEGCGAWSRVVGGSPEAVEAAVRAMWSAARGHVLGASAPDLRKG
ncbi:urease accessory protein UreD [Dietzia natronolimnaea]|uniref:Urease accessory protein UreD n=1 Tax=Dietzia natronolimnaea TaxID=161920 RepID=A0A2A2WPV5_9ACTN|nr:urease accessory protein UreD [Dietzia natronolimnaea]PAY23236.1 urease accessory protein UreD [Dietzia natronolimnaea]